MLSQPLNKNKQQQSRQLQDYREFLQNKIQELDRMTNQVICQIAEVLFENSQKLKDDIFEEWKQVHSSSKIIKDIQESEKSINMSLNQIHEKMSSIVNHTRLILQPEPQFVKTFPFAYNNYNNQRDNKPQFSQNQIKYIEAPKILNSKCPICYREMSNGSSYVKHMRKHDIEIQSQGYDCPHCEGSFNQCQLLQQHLYRKHFVIEDYQQTKQKNYYCPFTQQKFANNQSSQLAHVIRLSPHYTKAVDQILADQLKTKHQLTDEKKVIPTVPKLPLTKVEFIRGVTPGVFVHENLYGCLLCGLKEFKTVRNVGGHIKNAHGIKFRNQLYCPHCQLESKSAHELSTHLLSVHGSIEENQGARSLIYTTFSGLSFGDLNKLSHYIINDENYLTFFSSQCKNEPSTLE